MKLNTDIKPRRDGTVNVTVGDTTYTFRGVPLAAEVEDESHVSFLLNTSLFYPENAEDFERAGQTLGAALTANQDGDGDQDEEENENDGEELVNGGAPVEALTPAKPKQAAAKPAVAKPKAKAK